LSLRAWAHATALVNSSAVIPRCAIANLTEKKFSFGFNLIWVVQSLTQKYSGSLLTQITSTSLAVPAQHKGAFRDRHERRVGMRWTRAARLTSVPACGRRSRVVLTPRRWRQAGERNFAGNGGKKARSPRARNKLLKPSRAGMPGDPGELVVTNACAYYTSRTRLRVQRAPGIPRSPLGVAPLPSQGSAMPFTSGRKIQARLGRNASREGESACDEYGRATLPVVVARASGRSSNPRRR
jgi:hypothetical protein